MNRQTTVDRPGEIAAFVNAVQSGSFSAAARQLALTPSAVSKVVSRLESRLGVRLIHRTTRSLSLTAEGDHFFQRARRILAEIEEAELEAASARLSPRGMLRLHSGTAMGLHQLTPVLPEFCRRYAEIDIELTVNERRIDVTRLDFEEGGDIVLRTGGVERMTGETQVIARTLCDLERVICAAPSYLERRGMPRTPDDLTGHNCIRLLDHAELSRWPFKSAEGVRTIEVRGQHTANNAETVLQMGLAGLGIIRLVDVMLGADLSSGRLVPVLADQHHVEPVPLHVLMLRDKHRLPKVTAMVDFLFEKFASAPWRQPDRTVRRPVRRRLSAARSG
jgi:DNA-binding transcriptional LysR family regulator